MAVRVALATPPTSPSPALYRTVLVLLVCPTCSPLRHAILTVVRSLTQFVPCIESENVYRAAIFIHEIYLNMYLSCILCALTGRVIGSLPIEINTTDGCTIGNSLHDKIIHENFLNQTQIS